MISYRYDKEHDILLYYAKQLSEDKISCIIEKGRVDSSEEAYSLAKFFWQMVDLLVEDADQGKKVCGEENLQEWSELILNSLRAYLRGNGYGEEWDRASDDEE